MRGSLIGHIDRVCRHGRLVSDDNRVRLSSCGRIRACRIGGAHHQRIGIDCCGRGRVIRIHRSIVRCGLVGYISRVCRNNRLVGGNNRVRLSGCGHVRARRVGGTRHQRIGIGCGARGRVIRIHRRIMRCGLVDHISCVCHNGRLIGDNSCVRLSGCGHIRVRRVGGARHQRIGIGCCGRGRVVRIHRSIVRGSLIGHISRVCRNDRLVSDDGCGSLSGCGHVRARRVGGTRHQCIGIGCGSRSRVIRIHHRIMRNSLIGHIGRIYRDDRLIGGHSCVRLSGCGNSHARRIGGTRHQRIGIGCCGRSRVVRIHRRIMRGGLIGHIGRVCYNSRLIGGHGCVRLSGCGHIRAHRIDGTRHQCIGIGCGARGRIVRNHRSIMRCGLIGHIGRICRNSRLIGSHNRVRLSGCGHIRAHRIGSARHQCISISCGSRSRIVRIHRSIVHRSLVGYIGCVYRDSCLIGGHSCVNLLSYSSISGCCISGTRYQCIRISCCSIGCISITHSGIISRGHLGHFTDIGIHNRLICSNNRIRVRSCSIIFSTGCIRYQSIDIIRRNSRT